MKQSGIPDKLILEQPLVHKRECTGEKYWISYRPMKRHENIASEY